MLRQVTKKASSATCGLLAGKLVVARKNLAKTMLQHMLKALVMRPLPDDYACQASSSHIRQLGAYRYKKGIVYDHEQERKLYRRP